MGCAQSKRAPSKYKKDSLVADTDGWNEQYAQLTRARTEENAALFEVSTKSQRVPSPRRMGSFTERLASKAFSSLSVVAPPLSSGEKKRIINGYTLFKLLGQGAFGSVYLASRLGEEYAIKVLKRPPPQYWHPMMKKSGATNFNSIKAEIATMKKIDHPNCVNLFDVIIDELQDEILIVLEYVDGGPSQAPPKEGALPSCLSEKVIWSHTRHLILGLEYACMPMSMCYT